MSETEYRHPLAFAEEVAERLAGQIRRFGKQVEIAGSIRRKRPEVGDIDIVIEPLRGDSSQVASFVRRRWGKVVRGGSKYIRVIHPSGIGVCVYMVTPPAHWGVILAARTGPTALWLKAKEQLKESGLDTEDGEVQRRTRQGGIVAIPCRDEETFFKLAHLPFLPPTERDDPKALIPLEVSADALESGAFL